MTRFRESVRGMIRSLGILRPANGLAMPYGGERATVETALGTTEKTSLKRAVGLAAILWGATLFTVFLPKYTLASISADIGAFSFSLFVFSGGELLGALVAILGLAQYAKKGT